MYREFVDSREGFDALTRNEGIRGIMMDLVKNQNIAFEYPTDDLRLHPTGIRTWRGTVYKLYKNCVLLDMTQDSYGQFNYKEMINVRIEP